MEWHELDRDDGVMGYETGKIMLCFFSTVDKGLVFAWLTATLIFLVGTSPLWLVVEGHGPTKRPGHPDRRDGAMLYL